MTPKQKVEAALEELRRKETARSWPDFVPQEVRDAIVEEAVSEMAETLGDVTKMPEALSSNNDAMNAQLRSALGR